MINDKVAGVGQSLREREVQSEEHPTENSPRALGDDEGGRHEEAVQGRSGSDGGHGVESSSQRDEDFRAREVQGVSSAMSMESAAQPTLTGDERNDAVVNLASEQQNRAESWQGFAQSEEPVHIPPGVSAEAGESRNRKQQQESLNVGQLINQMAIQDKKIIA